MSDAEGAFSETRAFQAQLPQGARVVVHAQDAIGLGLLLGRDDITYRSSKNHGGAYTRFARVDRHWQDEGHLIDLVESECAQAHDRTYVVVNKRTGFPLRPSAGEQVILPRRPFLDLQPIDAYRVVCEALYKPSK